MDAEESKIFTAILIAAVVIGSIIAFFIITMVRQHKKVLLLQREKAVAEINALEQDRARIAADLHDDLSPILSAVKLRINSFELDQEDDEVQLTKANDSLDEVLKRMREISFDLMPQTLLRKGLIPAISQFLNQLGQSSNLKIKFSSPDNIPLDENKTVNLYRIIKEIIHNTIKHSKASQLVLQMKLEKGNMVFIAADDGIGFDTAEKIAGSTSIGFRSIINRTELMGGNITYYSKKNEGTYYKIEIPL